MKDNKNKDYTDLKKIRKLTKKPIIAIGGINQYNYKKLMLNKADFLAISSFIWKNKKLKPIEQFPYKYRNHMVILHKNYIDNLREDKKSITKSLVIDYIKSKW